MIIFKIALKAILTNKLRSFLTTLGVIIGVGSVVMLTAIGNGLSAFVTEQFNELGADTVIVFPGDIFGENNSGFDREAQITAFANSKFTLADVKAIEGTREFVRIAVPFNSNTTDITFQGKEENITAIGTTHDYQEAQGNIKVEKGRFFNQSENDRGKRVVFLGSGVAEEIFGKINPIGKKVKLSGRAFTVVGVAEEIGGGFGGPSFDTYVYIPLKASFKLYDSDTILEIVVKIKDKNLIPESIAAIEKTMSKRFEEDEFSVIDQSEILDTINEILGAFTVALGGIASISLVVGGIGIMNIMLVSVTERTREIGLRKALGATPNVILYQFLIEAALLSLLGGVIGLGLAYLGTLALEPFIPAKVTSQAVFLAFGVSMVVGLVFGAAPARRAAKLSPIEALRYE